MGCVYGNSGVDRYPKKETIVLSYNANAGSEKVSIKSFQLEKVIGKGSFGKVMLVSKKDTKEVYAMKILNKGVLERRNQRAHTATEREVLGKIKCPFIVKLFYAFQSSKKLYFVLEFLPGGELFYHLHYAEKFTEIRAAFYAAEITIALECLHKNNVIYRDLKPENVLLDCDGHIKLTDMGLSKEGVAFGPKKAYSFCGTPEYLAPEIIKGYGHDKAVDWWSLGTLIYEMLSGKSPHAHKDKQEIYKSILEKPVTMKPYFSDQAKSIIEGLLCINPQKRLGSSERDATDIKAHPFFAGIDWKALEERRVEPPFKPSVDGKDDCSNISRKILEETPIDTPVFSRMSHKDNDLCYEDFTYTRAMSPIKK